MKRYEAVVFDWDGTVMDSTHSIVAAIQGACLDLELPMPCSTRASWVIGLSLDQALRTIVPDLPAERLPLFLERYRERYLLRDQELRLFEGIVDLLDSLRARQIRLGVATGKGRAGLDRALASCGLHDYFHATRCADECFGKPHPRMLLEIMDELALEPDQILMVGDTSHDIFMANNAGVDSMAVSYGAHDERTLTEAGPTVLVHGVPEMQAWLAERI